MLYLNRDLNVNINEMFDLRLKSDFIIIIQFTEWKDPYLTPYYMYPDEDLCLFDNFPHKQLVIPSFAISDDVTNFECSCTLTWLIELGRFELSLRVGKKFFAIKILKMSC